MEDLKKSAEDLAKTLADVLTEKIKELTIKLKAELAKIGYDGKNAEIKPPNP